MKRAFLALICFALVFSLTSCANGAFTEAENKAVVSADGTEYTFVGNEGVVCCFGEREFLARVRGEKKTFTHLGDEIKAGMYSVGGDKDVLVRYLPDDEFAAVYVKAELLEAEITLDRCVKFVFVRELYSNDAEIKNAEKEITDCEQFLNEIKSGQKAREAGLYDLAEQSDGTLKNCYVYGYACGVIREDLNLVIPLTITSFDDKAYSITVDGIEYVLPQKWVNELLGK